MTPTPTPPPEKLGVGDILHNKLVQFGIEESAGCNCDSNRRLMNVWGPDLCKINIDSIVGWMKEEAYKRKLPFSSLLAKELVLWAIKKAKKQQ